MIDQPAGKGAAHNHYYTLAVGKVKVYPAAFRQTGGKAGEKVRLCALCVTRRKIGAGQVAQKGMWFFYGNVWEYVRFVLANKQRRCYHHDRRESVGLRSP